MSIGVWAYVWIFQSSLLTNVSGFFFVNNMFFYYFIFVVQFQTRDDNISRSSLVKHLVLEVRNFFYDFIENTICTFDPEFLFLCSYHSLISYFYGVP